MDSYYNLKFECNRVGVSWSSSINLFFIVKENNLKFIIEMIIVSYNIFRKIFVTYVTLNIYWKFLKDIYIYLFKCKTLMVFAMSVSADMKKIIIR